MENKIKTEKEYIKRMIEYNIEEISYHEKKLLKHQQEINQLKIVNTLLKKGV